MLLLRDQRHTFTNRCKIIKGVSKGTLNGNRNVTVWRVLRNRLHLKVHKHWFQPRCWPMDSLYVFVILAAQWHFEYHFRALFEIPCITSVSHIELSQVKLGVFCCIKTVQNTVHVLWTNYISFERCEDLFEAPRISRADFPYLISFKLSVTVIFSSSHVLTN
jgi:hypothetical protein